MPAELMGPLADTLGGDLAGRKFHGRAYLCRQRSEPDDLRHGGRARDCDAEFLRLHGVVGHGVVAGLRDRRMGVFRLARLLHTLTPRRAVEEARGERGSLLASRGQLPEPRNLPGIAPMACHHRYERKPTMNRAQRRVRLHFKGRALCADGSLTARSRSSTVRTS